MDRQAWIAVTLCIIGLIAWQVYMTQHAAVPPGRAAASPTAAPGAGNGGAQPGAAPGSTESRPTEGAVAPNEPKPTATPTPTAAPEPFVEKTSTLRNSDLELLLTNRGGGIVEAILPKHRAENGQPVKLSAHQSLPIGAIVAKPAAPVLPEFSVVAGKGSVQFARASEPGAAAEEIHSARAA